MRVLVTGGAGFIGSHLCDFLLAQGCEVVCMDSLLTGSTDNIAHISDPRFLFVKHDVTNYIVVGGPLDCGHYVPEHAPDVDFVSVIGRTVKIRLHDSQSPSRRGKPPHIDGASVFSHVGDAPPASISDWKFEGSTTRTVAEINFDSSTPPGAKVWVTAFWFNPRSQSGPACDPVSTHLQGGGVTIPPPVAA